ncbi:MAG TPA: DUF1707 domain-containing protein [Streptosporangiaceae bacterium]|nr:DUF1707 domain-containing protein [Streptosporangiaceae bacterium]
MASNPSVRASDQDRDRTAQLLSAHHAAGRLDPEEFAERLDRVYTAKTVDDLDELTADLPAIDLYPLPSASLPRNRVVSGGLPSASVLAGSSSSGRRVWPGRAPSARTVLWGSWSAVMVICLTLWAVSGNPWPLLWAAAVGIIVGGAGVARSALGSGGSRPQLGQAPPPGSIDDQQDERS